ncbi:MAG: putative membrane protein [Alphaproteobacteria bacterium]
MTTIQTISLLVYAIGLIYVITKTDYKRIIKERKWQHIVFGSTVAVLFLWSFRISIYDGLVIHFLWLTTLTLVLGFRWAVLVASTVLIIMTIIGNEQWDMLGVNGLIGVFLPILITYGIFAFSFHRIPRHLFVYIFLCAFFPGAITIGVKMLALGGYYFVEGVYTWDIIQYNYINMTLLMIFPEAFFNGFSITCLVIYKPDLVHTFHDKFYIDGK